MANSSESKYITYSENAEHPVGRDIPWVAYLSGNDELKNFYSIHWNMEKMESDGEGKRTVGHPPHMHKERELIFLIGMNPDNPYDLGAEVHICIGEDMQESVITKTCCIQIPANTPHGFYTIAKCDRPFMFVQVQEANPPTEKFLWEYLTQEEIASIPEHAMKFWVDKGYDE